MSYLNNISDPITLTKIILGVEKPVNLNDIIIQLEDNIIEYAEKKHGITIYKREECYNCEGGGWTAKLYPYGHTEVTCEICMGHGYIEYY